MSKGYIVIAQNNDTVDYLEQAYALAMNLKLTQGIVNNLTVCVDIRTKKLITAKHKKVFDHIIDIPWEDDAEDKEWKIPFTVPYLVGNESKYVNEARFHNQIGPCHRRPLTRFTAY